MGIVVVACSGGMEGKGHVVSVGDFKCSFQSRK